MDDGSDTGRKCYIDKNGGASDAEDNGFYDTGEYEDGEADDDSNDADDFVKYNANDRNNVT